MGFYSYCILPDWGFLVELQFFLGAIAIFFTYLAEIVKRKNFFCTKKLAVKVSNGTYLNCY